ncbi:hypothetical protein ACU4HD_35330 [Cupriavidus basilensis]
MKKALMVAVLYAAAVLSATPALAQQAKPAAKGAPATQAQPNVTEFDKQMAQVQENMGKMQAQMEKSARRRTRRSARSCWTSTGQPCKARWA